MRTYEEYERILTLWESGENKKAIARITGIPRATVRDCINRYGSLQNLERNRQWASRNTPGAIWDRIRNPENSEIRSVYAYLLGIYLGDGPKHERDIALEDWQQQIVDAYPLAFFRGLYHSDGSRFSNVVNGKDYPRYGFTNHSMIFANCSVPHAMRWACTIRRSGEAH